MLSYTAESILESAFRMAFCSSSNLNLNFISVHYVYIISCVLIASFMIYPGAGSKGGDDDSTKIGFIDCLLLASGSATQSGLNPVDLNRLGAFQQGILLFFAMITSPIFLHSLLVRARIYDFRNRFRSVLVSDDAQAKCHLCAGGEIGTTSTSFSPSGQVSRQRLLVYGTMEASNVAATAMMDGGGGSSTTSTNGEGSMGELPFQLRKSLVEGTHWSNETSRLSVRHMSSSSPSPSSSVELDKDEEEEQQPLLAGWVDGELQPANDMPLSHLENPVVHVCSDDMGISTSNNNTCSSFFPPPFPKSTMSSYSKWNRKKNSELRGIGIEYRALKMLFTILVGYFAFIHLVGYLFLIIWLHRSPYYESILRDARIDSGNWWAFFTAGSAFHNLGYTLTPDSMSSFNTTTTTSSSSNEATLPLAVMSFLAVVGNTGFPCMLRFIIWMLSKVAARWQSPLLWGEREEEGLRFLLDYPRRCFTMLFPREDTWRLFVVLLILNAVDMTVVFVLEWFMTGLFQVISTRTAGFSITSLTQLHPAIQVSFVVMMYISAFPTAISIRKTNVYGEEKKKKKSLEAYHNAKGDDNDNDNDNEDQGEIGDRRDLKQSDLGNLVEEQLGFDLWYIFLGLFLIAIIEGHRLQTGNTTTNNNNNNNTSGNSNKDKNDRNKSKPQLQIQQRAPNTTTIEPISLFSILFETVSAYGTVGLSLGYPGTQTSLSGQFRTLSKVVIVCMEVRGRHRGLPYSLDHAVLLRTSVRAGMGS